jgi:hypothetical protein
LFACLFICLFACLYVSGHQTPSNLQTDPPTIAPTQHVAPHPPRLK